MTDPSLQCTGSRLRVREDEAMSETSATDAGLADLIGVLPHAMLVHDDRGALLAANAAGAEILANRIEPIGAALPWTPPVERATTVDLQVVAPDGSTRWMTAQCQPLDRDGRRVAVTTVFDLTERKGWAQSAIEGVVQRFELSWARSHLPVFLVRVDDHGFGRVLVSNGALGDLVGGAEPVNGRHLSELFEMPGLPSAADVDDLLRRLIDSEDQGPTVTSRARRPDGSTRSVLLGLTVARGPAGRPIFALGYAIDQAPLEEAEAARQRTLTHTELIYEYGSDVVAVVSAEGRFDFIGPSSIDVLGYDRTTLIGDLGWDLIHPDDEQLARQALAETVARPGDGTPVHLRIRDGFDQWRPVEIVARNLLDVPEVEGIVLTIRDRSDAARAEAETAERERRYRQIVELATDGIAAAGPNRRIDFVNQRLTAIVGRSTGDLLDRDVAELFAPASRAAAMAHLWDGDDPAEPLRVDLQRADGTVSPAIVAAAHRHDGEDLVNVVVWITDLSEVETARAELERSERQMVALLDALPDLIFQLDAQGTYLDFHSTDLEMLVLPPERFLGRCVDDVLTEDIAPGVAREFHRAIDAALRTGVMRTVNYEVDLPGGTRQFEARIAPVSDDEVIAVVRDTTDLHRAEHQRVEHEREVVRHQAELERAALERELERASRTEAMGYLAATMAHDVNNLLGVINNYASSIRRSDPTPEVRSDAEQISAAVARGAELTQRLLRIGRRPAEQLELEPVRDLVHGLADSLRSAFDREGGVDLVTELPDHPATVRGSRPRIEQAVMNLVLNARDAAAAAGGRIVVTLSVELRTAGEHDWRPEEIPPGEYVVVSVVDGGGGIPEPVRDRIFEPFFSTKEGTNSGLGLPIVREVAEQHGGGVGIHAVEVDGVAGTRMELWLPAVLPEEGLVATEPPPRTARRVLLVDDDDDVRRSTRQLLERLGHEVVDVRGASGALAMIEGGEPVDLVVSDLRMPGTSGVVLARRLRAVAPRVPVVFVTGYADDLVGAEDLADIPVLVKPYGLDDLAELVEAHATRG